MALSIKNPRAEQLAREVARETGESITQSLINALEERLQRVRGRKTSPDLVSEILEISQHCSALPDLDARSPDEILGYNREGGFD
jgi:antitoxin VapB